MATSTTQQKSVTPVCEAARQTTGSAQWLLECGEDENHPVHHVNKLDLFVCGETAFAQIAADLKNAKGSVEIICWGFDPAMELIRAKDSKGGSATWRRGDTWGDLLRDVAAGKYNGGKPVEVRLLSWYGCIGSTAAGNMPGYGQSAKFETRQAISRGIAGAFMPGGSKALPPPAEPTDPKDKREVFNARWYRDVTGGLVPNLTLRTRDGDFSAVRKSLKEELGKRDLTESMAMSVIATDHQKTILIDYDHAGGTHAVGYVMGLNSVTDYWDTKEHLFYDPRRGESWEGGGDSDYPDLKPYQDYACRIRGAALVAVSKNFTDAWNRAKGKGGKLARTHDLKRPPSGLVSALTGECQRAQIVRTQPEEGDKSIQRLYKQASSFARHYLYVENQYFQYAQWSRELKKNRTEYVEGWKKGGKSPADLPNLHVMVVAPTPEHGFMVPRTHDTVKSLGYGASMPNQNKKVDDEFAKYERDMAAHRKLKSTYENSGFYEKVGIPPEPKLGKLAEASLASGRSGSIGAELQAMGMRALVASLWTCDFNWSRANQEVFKTIGAEQESYARRKANYDKAIEAYEQEMKRQDEAIKRMIAAGGMPAWGPMNGTVRPVPPRPPGDRKKEVDEAIAKRYREIYIHSKLMIIDDAMFTVGSANLNERSMVGDAEINVASDNVQKSTALRREVWAQLSGNTQDGGDGSPARIADTFEKWVNLMKKNKQAKDAGGTFVGFLMPFEDKRTSGWRAS
jgi:phosphatidylserine/phosphatidylglycerophosphate/cardiolipin synthase-like enzyme